MGSCAKRAWGMRDAAESKAMLTSLMLRFLEFGVAAVRVTQGARASPRPTQPSRLSREFDIDHALGNLPQVVPVRHDTRRHRHARFVGIPTLRNRYGEASLAVAARGHLQAPASPTRDTQPPELFHPALGRARRAPAVEPVSRLACLRLVPFGRPRRGQILAL